MLIKKCTNQDVPKLALMNILLTSLLKMIQFWDMH